MTGLVSRYIFTRIGLGIGATLVILALLDYVLVALLELASLSGDYGLLQSLQYLWAIMPQRVFLLLPYATLFGVGWVVAQMADNRELDAMRACGLSKNRFMLRCMVPILLYACVGLGMAEWVIPKTQRAAESERDELRNAHLPQKPDRKIQWLQDNNAFVRIGAWTTPEQLQDVHILYFSDQRLTRALQAQSATYEYKDKQWKLHQVQAFNLDQQGAKIQAEEHQELTIHSTLTPEIIGETASPGQMSISQLYRHRLYQRTNQDIANDYALELWRRAALPLDLLIMAMLAIALMFRSRRISNNTGRLFAGIGLGLGVGLIRDLAGLSSLAYEYAPLYAVLAYTLLMLGGGFWLLNRA